MIVLALLAVVTPLSATGTIWIHTEPGVTVYLDGLEAGVTTRQQGGLRIHDVATGQHELALEIPGGGSTTVVTYVRARRTTDVRVSSLALRGSLRSRSSAIEIRLTNAGPGCVAAVGDKQESMTAETVTIDDIPAGIHEVVIACGGRSLARDVRVPPGRTLVIGADLEASEVRLLGDRPRVTQLFVDQSVSGRIAALPGAARRVLMGLLARSPRVRLVGLDVLSERAVNARFEMPDRRVAGDFAERLEETPGVQEITLSPPRVTRGRVNVAITIVFEKEQ
jgi:hypothetical protein